MESDSVEIFSLLPANSFICLDVWPFLSGQNNAVFNDVDGMAKAAGGIAGGLLAWANRNSVNMTRGEIAILYKGFINAFENIEIAILYKGFINAFKRLVTNKSALKYDHKPTLDNLTIRWSVDYGPCSQLADIMQVGFKSIREIRTSTDGPKLPAGWGF